MVETIEDYRKCLQLGDCMGFKGSSSACVTCVLTSHKMQSKNSYNLVVNICVLWILKMQGLKLKKLIGTI